MYMNFFYIKIILKQQQQKIIIPQTHNTKPHPQKCKTVEKP